VLVAGSTWRIVGYTVIQALLSTLVSVVCAIPATYVLYRLRVPGRRILLALVTVPFVLPTVVVGLAFRELLPFAGTTAAIIVAHAFFNIGLVIRIVGGVWGQLDPRPAQVATTLGAPPWRVFTDVTVPQLRSALLASAILVFLFSFTSFGVVLVVGDPALPTIEVEIYRKAIQILDLNAAATLTLLQLVIIVVALAFAVRLQAQVSTGRNLTAETHREPIRGLGNACAVAATGALVAALLLPIIALAARSIRVGDGWGLQWFVEIFNPTDTTTRATTAWTSLTVSLRYAAIATAIAVPLGVMAAVVLSLARRGRTRLDTVISLPLGVSAVSIGLGLLLFSLTGPLDLRGWSLLVPLGQALVAMPLVVRVVLPVLRSIDPRLREVAATLGASPARAWLLVDGPLALRAAAISAGLAAAVSLGEFGATAFLVRADAPTVPVQIVRLLGRPGEANLGQAAALSVILIVLTALVVGLAERARPAKSTGW
jgi:thiamine transport system permease protein